MNALKAHEIRGTWAPLFLQIKEHSVIDFGFIDEEIAIIQNSGVSGVYAGTNSSEFFNLTFTEYCRLIERFASSCHRHGIAYQLGACHAHPYESLERVAVAADHAPAAIHLILPDWVEANRRGVLRFMKGCAKNSRGRGLILCNPPNAKIQLTPEDYLWLANEVPELVGISASGGDDNWYEAMQPVIEQITVLVPGQSMATGLSKGAHGSCSSIAGMNPCAAQSWNELTLRDQAAGLELEKRIQQFVRECINPLVTEHNYPLHACSKFMAVISGWCDGLHQRLRWPYSWVEDNHIEPIRARGKELIPEFFEHIK
ncbi:dihydrodipicolinate synthase family protein [Parendozoicomonas sp. Alg238-R29]|uniref:dihydrodipicolinate synthase family protein n=1 Tax=Parendozoicomonas sp. Alg238-R29 TaxID=2993446 RepID=UPI00248F1B96|nr:dihydrodipicolinate synthase family protein [Parendozoicomonas sp. Alg238-R29]